LVRQTWRPIFGKSALLLWHSGASEQEYQERRRLRQSPAKETKVGAGQNAEIRRLKAELLRVTEERDILKKATVYFAKDAK
jgi:transposase